MVNHNQKSDVCKEQRRRTALPALLCALALLLSACGLRPEPAPTPSPEPTPVPTASATATPEPSPTPEPTPEPSPTPAPTPHWEEAEEKEEYLLFTGNSTGGKALGAWLTAEGAALAAEYVPAELNEPLFTLAFTPRESAGGIPAAGEETRYILLSVDRQLLESGLLQAILPVFENSYGYVVEICTGEPDSVQSWAGVNAADAALLSESCAAGLNRRGYSAVTVWARAGYELVF